MVTGFGCDLSNRGGPVGVSHALAILSSAEARNIKNQVSGHRALKQVREALRRRVLWRSKGGEKPSRKSKAIDEVANFTLVVSKMPDRVAPTKVQT